MDSAAAAKKWRAALPRPAGIAADQPQVGLVHQGRGVERLAGRFAGQPTARPAAQLVIDQRQELAGGLRLAPPQGVEDGGDVAHRRCSRIRSCS